mmetsp:Transcript_19536/g.62638  ORF Transcript_19536/g.62638 Transcript_19536/m.62638 type:complete len:614 (-) Transcript_19536:133-1974(-)
MSGLLVRLAVVPSSATRRWCDSLRGGAKLSIWAMVASALATLRMTRLAIQKYGPWRARTSSTMAADGMHCRQVARMLVRTQKRRWRSRARTCWTRTEPSWPARNRRSSVTLQTCTTSATVTHTCTSETMPGKIVSEKNHAPAVGYTSSTAAWPNSMSKMAPLADAATRARPGDTADPADADADAAAEAGRENAEANGQDLSADPAPREAKPKRQAASPRLKTELALKPSAAEVAAVAVLTLGSEGAAEASELEQSAAESGTGTTRTAAQRAKGSDRAPVEPAEPSGDDSTKEAKSDTESSGGQAAAKPSGDAAAHRKIDEADAMNGETGDSKRSGSEAGVSAAPRPSKRRIYTDVTRKAIIEAYRTKGRRHMLEVAKSHGMPGKTADDLVCRFKKGNTNALHDHRLDKGKAKSYLRKIDDELGRLLKKWFTDDPTESFVALKEKVNREILRRIIIRDFSESITLSKEEEAAGGPLNDWQLLLGSNSELRTSFDAQGLRSDQTVRNWIVKAGLLRERRTRRRSNSKSADGAPQLHPLVVPAVGSEPPAPPDSAPGMESEQTASPAHAPGEDTPSEASKEADFAKLQPHPSSAEAPSSPQEPTQPLSPEEATASI